MRNSLQTNLPPDLHVVKLKDNGTTLRMRFPSCNTRTRRSRKRSLQGSGSFKLLLDVKHNSSGCLSCLEFPAILASLAEVDFLRYPTLCGRGQFGFILIFIAIGQSSCRGAFFHK